MTIEEAKYTLKLMFCHDCPYAHSGDCNGKECKLAMDMAIEALEKQVPKKPTPDASCAVCGWYLVTRYGIRLGYCSHCGQKIDWSDKNDT